MPVKVAIDGVHFHEVDCIMWNSLKYVPGRRECVDWAIDVAVDVGEIRYNL